MQAPTCGISVTQLPEGSSTNSSRFTEHEG